MKKRTMIAMGIGVMVGYALCKNKDTSIVIDTGIEQIKNSALFKSLLNSVDKVKGHVNEYVDEVQEAVSTIDDTDEIDISASQYDIGDI